jgi:hypothetical protein
LVAGLGLVATAERDLAHRAEDLLVGRARADDATDGFGRLAPLGVGLGLELEGHPPGHEQRVLGVGGIVPRLSARD